MRDNRVGFVVFFPDQIDAKIRSARYTITDLQLASQSPSPAEEQYPSLSGRALEKIGRLEDLPKDLQAHLIRFSAADAYAPQPLSEVRDSKISPANYNGGASRQHKIH